MVSKIISEERLTKYLKAAAYDEERALALYGWNIQLSESFFPVLGAAEVCLRNTVVARLIKEYGDHWWQDPRFHEQIKSAGKRIVLTAHDQLKKRGAVTSGRMTGELNFGFWVKMLLPRHKNVLWMDLHADFQHLPREISYETLHERCDEVPGVPEPCFSS